MILWDDIMKEFDLVWGVLKIFYSRWYIKDEGEGGGGEDVVGRGNKKFGWSLENWE